MSMHVRLAFGRAPLRSSRRSAHVRAGLGRLLVALAALLVLPLAVGCGDDSSGGSNGGVADVEGSWSLDPAPAPAMAGGAGGAADCTLDLSSFLIVQEDVDAMLLAGSVVIPAEVLETDEFVIDVDLDNEALSSTTIIAGTLAVSDGGARLDGPLTVTTVGGISACGPTQLDIAASRDSASLPGPAPELSAANGSWEFTNTALDLMGPTSCTPPSPPLSTGLQDASIAIDVPVAGVATITFDESPSPIAIEADMIGLYLVSGWEADLDGGALQQNLTVLRYSPAIPAVFPDFLTGFTQSILIDGAESCEDLEEHQAFRPAPAV